MISDDIINFYTYLAIRNKNLAPDNFIYNAEKAFEKIKERIKDSLIVEGYCAIADELSYYPMPKKGKDTTYFPIDEMEILCEKGKNFRDLLHGYIIGMWADYIYKTIDREYKRKASAIPKLQSVTKAAFVDALDFVYNNIDKYKDYVELHVFFKEYVEEARRYSSDALACIDRIAQDAIEFEQDNFPSVELFIAYAIKTFKRGKYWAAEYGGASWARIAHDFLAFYKSRAPSITDIDHMLDLVHNTDTWLDKFVYADDLSDALYLKFVLSPEKLADKCTDKDIKRLAKYTQIRFESL